MQCWDELEGQGKRLPTVWITVNALRFGTLEEVTFQGFSKVFSFEYFDLEIPVMDPNGDAVQAVLCIICSSCIISGVEIEIQQHGFKLHWSTYMGTFSINIQSAFYMPEIRIHVFNQPQIESYFHPSFGNPQMQRRLTVCIVVHHLFKGLEHPRTLVTLAGHVGGRGLEPILS